MIKVFRIKDLIKYLAKILIVLLAVAFAVKVFGGSKNSKVANTNLENIENNQVEENNAENSENENNEASNSKEVDNKKSKAMLFCIDDVLPQIGINKENNETKETSAIQFAFSSELEVMEALKNANETVENTNQEKQNTNQEENVVGLGNNSEDNAETTTGINLDWTVNEVDNSGVNPRYTDEYNGVLINNGTNYTLTQEMLTPDVTVNKNKVVIYHTHTCESYTPTEAYSYTASGNFRTIDLNYSVSRVGDELEKCLTNYGCTVIHDRTYHDYPAYNGSYSRSLVTAENILSANQDADIVIDLHRDAIADETYGPRVKIGDEYVSQLMFVIGTDGSNSAHTNWLQNLKFAIKVQQKANELYPGLFKPIILRNSEYNQHVAKAACIIEVGSTGNTLEESMGAMKYLARIIEEM